MTRLRVMWWNVLADGLAQRGGFRDVRLKTLQWESRFERIKSIFLQEQPDIFVAAEGNRFEDSWKPFFESQDYTAYYQPKESAARGFVEQRQGEEKHTDASPSVKSEEEKHDNGILFAIRRRVMEEAFHSVSLAFSRTKDPVAVAFEARTKGENLPFLVVGLHLKAKGGFEERRKGQIERVLRDVEKWQRRGVAESSGPTRPLTRGSILLLGDFNAEDSEPCFEELRNAGFRRLSTADGWTTWKVRAESSPEVRREFEEHFGGGASSESEGKGPKTLSHEGEKKRVIDYAFSFGEAIQIEEREGGYARRFSGPLPTEEFPSDHIPLLLKVKL